MDNNYSYEQIIENLKSDNTDDFTKIFSILSLSELKNISDAELVINHLTNHPTPIREALAYKLEDIFEEKFFNEFIKSKFLNAIVDINPNISRAVCSLISNNSVLKEELEKDIIIKIEELLEDIKLEKQDNNNQKSHAKNKKFFSLYWLLEALSICLSEKYKDNVLKILNYTIYFYDYTIREKTAKILAKMPDAPFDLLQIAKSDTNFYVKNQVYDKINFED